MKRRKTPRQEPRYLFKQKVYDFNGIVNGPEGDIYRQTYKALGFKWVHRVRHADAGKVRPDEIDRVTDEKSFFGLLHTGKTQELDTEGFIQVEKNRWTISNPLLRFKSFSEYEKSPGGFVGGKSHKKEGSLFFGARTWDLRSDKAEGDDYRRVKTNILFGALRNERETIDEDGKRLSDKENKQRILNLGLFKNVRYTATDYLNNTELTTFKRKRRFGVYNSDHVRQFTDDGATVSKGDFSTKKSYGFGFNASHSTLVTKARTETENDTITTARQKPNILFGLDRQERIYETLNGKTTRDEEHRRSLWGKTQITKYQMLGYVEKTPQPGHINVIRTEREAKIEQNRFNTQHHHWSKLRDWGKKTAGLGWAVVLASGMAQGGAMALAATVVSPLSLALLATVGAVYLYNRKMKTVNAQRNDRMEERIQEFREQKGLVTGGAESGAPHHAAHPAPSGP